MNAGRLPAADDGQQIPRLQRFFADANVAQRRSGHRFLVAPVANCEIERVRQRRDFLPQNSYAERVKRAYQRLFRAGFSEQFRGSFLHFAGGFFGKLYRQYFIGGDPVANQLGHPMGDDAGLSRAGAGQNQERSGKRPHGFLLGRVEFCQWVHIIIRSENERIL